MTGAFQKSLLLTLAATLVLSLDSAPAGDILRGGSSAGQRRAEAAAFIQSQAGQAAAMAASARTQDRLARTTMAVQNMQAAQAAARATAAALNTVPNGLGANGLDPLTVPDPANPGKPKFDRWEGADAPTQNGLDVNIRQTAAQAVLHWKTFNVGRDTTLNFDQSAGGADAGKWVAINKVFDPQARPSQILGRINAQGQVYIVNPNGILFGGASQVNTRALVASTLQINEDLLQRGLLNQQAKDPKFLFDSSGAAGDVIVEQGALLAARSTAEKVGGRVTLIGNNVRNKGTISTPDGQTILAAGRQIGLDAHPSSDPTLRGLDVYIGNVGDGGTVENTGLINAPRANVTMAGKTVRQAGIIESSTTTALNGRVDLLANYGATPNTAYKSSDLTSPLFYHRATGTVEIAAGSVTRILPELSAGDRAVGTQLALPSLINIQGRAVRIGANASILAPGAAIPNGLNAVTPRDGSRQDTLGRLESGVTVRAGEWSGSALSTSWAPTRGQIYLEPGSIIDVSGTTGVDVPLSHRILTLQLRGAELANSPLQRGGAVRGSTINVDLRRSGVFDGYAWVGTPLGDVTGYIGLIERNVGQLTVAGGTVSLTAGDSIVTQPGSIIDVSGGWMRHAAGTVQTTLLSENGRLVDIGDATPDRVYDGIYTGLTRQSSSRWGVSKTYNIPLAKTTGYREESYIEGADAGSIRLAAASMALDGTLRGEAIQGPRQLNADKLDPAMRGSLSISFQAAKPANPVFLHSPTPPSIRFDALAALAPVGQFALDADGNAALLPEERRKKVVLSPGLLAGNGFGQLTVENSDGDIIVPTGTSLNAPLLGSISLRAANLSIDGAVSAPGGALDFHVFNFSPFVAAELNPNNTTQTPPPNAGRGIFALGRGASLSTAGLLADNTRFSLSIADAPPLLTGGSIAISAYTARLAPGSSVDASGGALIDHRGRITYGEGGSIAINAGRNPDPKLDWVLGGKLQLGATITAWSGGKGGSLAVQAPRVQIGGERPVGTDAEELLVLSPSFFQQGGFSSYSISGIGKESEAAVRVTARTLIRPVTDNRLVGFSSGRVGWFGVQQEEGVRTPASLSLGSRVIRDQFDPFSSLLARGDIVMEAGSRIETDAGANVSLSGGTVAVLGTINAPGGDITLAGADRFPLFKPLNTDDPNIAVALPTLNIGPQAVVSAAGRTVLVRDYAYGNRTGKIWSGGNIEVRGNIVAEKGAVLDVSGASGVLDLHPDTLGRNIAALNGRRGVPATSGVIGPVYAALAVPTTVQSDGGSISLLGSQQLFSDATLRGLAGGPTAQGGRLTISSGRFNDPRTEQKDDSSPLNRNLIVRASGDTIPDGFYTPGETAIGRVVPVAAGSFAFDRGHFSIDRFTQGDFDALTLNGGIRGTVAFEGDVSVTARRALVVAEGGVIWADGNVVLQAPHVALGTAFRPPVQINDKNQEESLYLVPGSDREKHVTPTDGSGTLTVRASLIDIGNLSLQNIGTANFIAEGGDIRGNGSLNIAGTANFRAGQIYPTTGSTFSIVAFDPADAPGGGAVNIANAGARPMPLSAGGTLNVYAANIDQSGTLHAPFGRINLGWDGSGSSPKDYLSGAGIQGGAIAALPVTQDLTLGSGSVTSVSGGTLYVPYGFAANEKSWIDPTGLDVTATGAGGKDVVLSALSSSLLDGATIDLSGGGELLAARWIAGNGGSVDILGSTSATWSADRTYNAGQLVTHNGSTWSARRSTRGTEPVTGLDWVRVPESFAVLPGYAANYAPYAPFNLSTSALNLAASDAGFNDTRFAAGDRVYLGAGGGLAAGVYTLLPARYAILPGAALVTPKGTVSALSIGAADGTALVGGYRFNDLAAGHTPAQAERFEVATGAALKARAEYSISSANQFFAQSAQELGLSVPLLPRDGGRAVLYGRDALRIDGSVLARGAAGGFGGDIDIATTADIYLGTGMAAAGAAAIDAARLSTFSAGSLLVGGTRRQTSTGREINVTTRNITVDNAGTPLVAPEIILTAKNGIDVQSGSRLQQSGASRPSGENISIGSKNSTGSGDGVLVRVADRTADLSRAGVSAQLAQSQQGDAAPRLRVAGDVLLEGDTVLLDSTYASELDENARLSAREVGLAAGHINVQTGGYADLPDEGLALTRSTLDSLQRIDDLKLSAYSSLDFFGAGEISAIRSLSLSAPAISAPSLVDETARLSATTIVLGGIADTVAASPNGARLGSLSIGADSVKLRGGPLSVGAFSGLQVEATSFIATVGDGILQTDGSLQLSTPLLTAVSGSYTLESARDIAVRSISGAATSPAPTGLGATLALTGTDVSVDSTVAASSGTIRLKATMGEVSVGRNGDALIDVSGSAKQFGDIVRYADAGKVELKSEAGSVILGERGRIDVSANSAGGNAGSLAIASPLGIFAFDGALDGSAAAGWRQGSFALDTGRLSEVTAIDNSLNGSGFTASRTYRVREGDVSVNGTATARSYELFADRGSVFVGEEASIDASGKTGGSIRIGASGSVTFDAGARLSVRGEEFDSAGKGGSIVLEAGNQTDGFVDAGAVLDLRGGSSLDLTVEAQNEESASLGKFAGTLHLRAPYLGGLLLNVNPLDADISGASSILVEGYKLFDRTGQSSLDASLLAQIRSHGEELGANAADIGSFLVTANPTLESSLVVGAGAEIINRNGDLVLGSENSTTSEDWDLSTFRFGPETKRAPGVLTLRASGDLVFYNSLSDGFASSSYTAELLDSTLEGNRDLPPNLQSWSYRLAAGADMSAADFRATRALEDLPSAETGSVRIGKLYTDNNGIPFAAGGASATTADFLSGKYYAQTIRTGSGSIEIAAGRDVQLLNRFSTVYSAGTRVTDATLGDRFQVPPRVNVGTDDDPMGAPQQKPTYAAQYSLGGGSITVSAQRNIERMTIAGGNLVADSQLQIPNNWLNRRGYIDPSTGQFVSAPDDSADSPLAKKTIASTSWWVDFSNFFQGIGALGGGHVKLIAGNDVSNVDAVAPTSGRVTYKTESDDRNATRQTLVELGGGDILVRAGRDIDAGIYYVERGNGALEAGRDIITNPTRSAYARRESGITAGPKPSEEQWLPTTLFLGKGGFNVRAAGDLTLGPTVNPFLLPIGINNSFMRKSYFSTYAADSAVDVASLSGKVTIRSSSSTTGSANDRPVLLNFLESVHLFAKEGTTDASLSVTQPWLRLGETSVEPFASVLSLLPGTFRATSFSEDIEIAGNLTLSPSARGTLELVADNSLSGFSSRGIYRSQSSDPERTVWSSSTINVSDADPNDVPGLFSPFAYQSLVGGEPSSSLETQSNFLDFIDRLLAESGSSSGPQGVIQTQQALHGRSLLHAADNEPVRLFAEGGSISGLTLFSPKAARVQAGQDVTDIALYIQNTKASDASIVRAGRDIIAFNANSPSRTAAQGATSVLQGGPLNGDIQISGPGSLQVTAGRNIDLGTGAGNSDGTGTGLTSVGNARNPNLPFEGARLLVGAGLGASDPDYTAFIEQNVLTSEGEKYLAEIYGRTADASFANLNPAEQRRIARQFFEGLGEEQKHQAALEVFYLVLRDAGRNKNQKGNYDTGFAAIKTLFPGAGYSGEIITRSRDIRTKSGGDISIFAPGGGLQLAQSLIGNPLAPPGIVTEAGGRISIFADRDVDIGIARIFTLRGGDQIIWSSKGDIAAGTSSKTVQSAPPTRVLIDPQTGDLKVDLAGLATGGGIGVLASVQGVKPGSVDLIAPSGTVDAGDAGIRATGNLNIAADRVLNADNIAAGGVSVGVPAAAPPAAPNLGGLSASTSSTAATSSAARTLTSRSQPETNPANEAPSNVTVEVLGYGGGEGEEEEREDNLQASLR